MKRATSGLHVFCLYVSCSLFFNFDAVAPSYIILVNMKKVFFLLAMFTCIFASCSDEDESVTIGQSGTVEGSYSDGVVKIATAGTLKNF